MLIFKYSIHSKLSISLLEPVAFEFRVIFFLSFCRDTHFSLCGGSDHFQEKPTQTKRNAIVPPSLLLASFQSEMQFFLPPSLLLRFSQSNNNRFWGDCDCESASFSGCCFCGSHNTKLSLFPVHRSTQTRCFVSKVCVARVGDEATLTIVR